MSDSPLAASGMRSQPPVNDAVAGDLVPTVDGIAGRRLNELTQQAHEDGLHDVDADAYKEALA